MANFSANDSNNLLDISAAVNVLDEDREFYLITSVLQCSAGAVVNIIILVQIFGYRNRITLINVCIGVQSILGLILTFSQLAMCAIMLTQENFCAWSYLLFPGILLAIKLLYTSIGIVRHCYIYCHPRYRSPYVMIAMVVIMTLLSIAPNLSERSPLLYRVCAAESLDNVGNDKSHVFVYIYLIVFSNSLVVDIIVYVRIFGFIRKNSVQVAVVATTDQERRQTINLITAPSSFLLTLVSTVAMLPPIILRVRSPSGSEEVNASKAITLFKYQVFSVYCLAVVVPLMMIGSSPQIRSDIVKCKSKMERIFSDQKDGSNDIRMEVYAIPEGGGRDMTS